MSRQKRVLAVHDISGVGRCSLTVALPIISACGIETSVLPTAILSTHTGGFKDYTYRDLSCDIIPVTNHWRSLGIRFDAVYSGFLGSFEQLDIMYRLFSEYKSSGAVIIVDPVLGDNGSLYPVFGPEFVQGMRRLCSIADIITPNITEAALLTGNEYRADGDSEYISALMQGLMSTTSQYAVLTGVVQDGETGAAVCDKKTGKVRVFTNAQIDGVFHGTGDVFASCMTGAYMKCGDIYSAVKIAVDFTLESIMLTHGKGTDYRYGVCFEEALPHLISLLQTPEQKS